VQIEKQVMVPQLLIKVNREALQRYGLQAGKVAQDLEIFYNGKVTGQILDGNKTFDILLRTTDEERTNIEAIRNTLIDAPNGNTHSTYNKLLVLKYYNHQHHNARKYTT
jgi:Cu/Ag efflux pump CusA